MRNLAIIPARSGSKGLPDKNIKELNGKALMAYSIEAAKESGMFDEVMVSTDSELYADIAKRCGAVVPFYRSEEMASDTAGSWDMVKEVLEKYKEMGKSFDTVCLLQPTSPLRNAEDIASAYSIYEKKNGIAVVSVCEMEHSLKLCNTLPENGSLNGFIVKSDKVRRQDQETTYRLNGAIYIVNTEELYKDSFLYREGSFAYVMPTERSVDIDTLRDFEYVEFLVSKGY